MYKAEIDISELSSLEYALRGEIESEPHNAVFRTLHMAASLIGANVPDYTRAQNSFYTRTDRYSPSPEDFVVFGSLKVRCAHKVIQLSRLLVADNAEKVAESRATATLNDGRYRAGVEVVKILEGTEKGPRRVVTAKRINNGLMQGLRLPKGEPLDDFLISTGPVLEDIVGQSLDDTTDFGFVAKLTQDYLRTEFMYSKLNYPEYFAVNIGTGQR